jgi:cell division protein FtsA
MKKEEPEVIVPQITDEPTLVAEIEVKKTEESTGDRIKKSFFDKYIEKIKEFLDNAE